MVAVAQTRGIAPSLLVSPTEAFRTGPPPRYSWILVSPSAAGLDYRCRPLQRPGFVQQPRLDAALSIPRLVESARCPDSRKARTRSGRRHQAELTEQLGLIEVEMLRGQLFAANVVARHPAEVDVPSSGWDLAFGRAHDAGVRADKPAFGGGDGSFGEQARGLKTPVRKCVPEHAEEAQNLLAAVLETFTPGSRAGSARRIYNPRPGMVTRPST